MGTTSKKQIDDKLKDLEEGQSLDSVEIAQTWNSGHEELLAAIADRCLGLSWMHNRCKLWYERTNFWLTIPSIIIGTLSGSATIGLSSLFPNNQQSAQVTLGILTLSCGVFSAVNNFLKSSVLSESHRITSLHYSKLHRTIQSEIGLRRDQRVIAKEFIGLVRSEQDRLEETAPSVLDSVIKRFRREFGSKTNLQKPEIAGDLDHVHINKSTRPNPNSSKQSPKVGDSASSSPGTYTPPKYPKSTLQLLPSKLNDV